MIETITLPTPFSIGPINCYLLRGDPLTLVDAGPNSTESLEVLEAGLRERGLRIADIEFLLLTHQHLDHFGAAARIREASGCVVGAHELLAEYVSDYPVQTQLEDDFQSEVMRLHGIAEDAIETIRGVSQAYRRYGASVEVGRPLEDGHVVEVGALRFETILRPGHSPTDTIFVDDAARVGLVGDHLLQQISSNPVVHRPRTGPSDPRNRTSSLLTYLDSLRRTAELDLDVLYAGHRAPIEGHRALVASRLEHHRTRVERVHEYLQGEPRTAYWVARQIWGDELALRQAYLTLSEVLGAIDVLLGEERVVETFDGVYRYATS